MLKLKGLSAGYGTVRVLHDVNLTVPPNSTVVLLGPNGAGKTTLLKAACGLVRATAGDVCFDGRPVTSLPVHRRANDGLYLIPEGRGVFRQLSVRDNLAMWVDRAALPDAIAQVADAFPVLGQRLGQPAGTLSGGQQQMLAVARALVNPPRVLLIDEVSLGLAPVIIDEIYASLDRLRSAGTSFLLVEQYVERALELADFVYVLNKGRVVWVGEGRQCRADEIFDRYLDRSPLTDQAALGLDPRVAVKYTYIK